jgi:hypothetical protein
MESFFGKFFGSEEEIPVEESWEQKKVLEFDVIDDILRHKKGILLKIKEETGTFPKKFFNSFFVSIVLSFYEENIFILNELNKYKNMDPEVLYRFLLQTIPRQKSFRRTFKKNSEREERLKMLGVLYGWSRTESEKNLRMFSDEDFAEIKTYLNSEGVRK